MNELKSLELNGTELFVNISNDQKVRVLKAGEGKPLVLMHTGIVRLKVVV